MSLLRRNRHNAYIDGVHYYWIKDSRGDNGRGDVTVQHANAIGSKLLIDPYGRFADDEVCDGIRFAIASAFMQPKGHSTLARDKQSSPGTQHFGNG